LEHVENIDEKQAIFEGARPAQIAGPPLTASQFHCASLPLDPVTAANARRANQEAHTAKPYLPMANFEPSREEAISSDWMPTGDGATMPDIPAFLLRPPVLPQPCARCGQSFKARTWRQKNCNECQVHP